MFYPNANKEARKHVVKEVADNPMIYPPADVAKTLFVIKPQPLPAQRLQTRMWADLKSGRSPPCWIINPLHHPGRARPMQSLASKQYSRFSAQWWLYIPSLCRCGDTRYSLCSSLRV